MNTGDFMHQFRVYILGGGGGGWLCAFVCVCMCVCLCVSVNGIEDQGLKRK